MKLLPKILLTFLFILLFAIILAIFYKMEWITGNALKNFLFILTIILLLIIIGFLFLEMWNPVHEGVKMKITSDVNLEQTKEEMARKGVIITLKSTKEHPVISQMYQNKQCIIHYFIAHHRTPYSTLPCFFMRRLDDPDIKSYMIDALPEKDEIRNMINMISSGKLDEEETEIITRNALTGIEQHVRHKSSKLQNEQKETLVPAQKPEAPKEAVPNA